MTNKHSEYEDLHARANEVIKKTQDLLSAIRRNASAFQDEKNARTTLVETSYQTRSTLFNQNIHLNAVIEKNALAYEFDDNH